MIVHSDSIFSSLKQITGIQLRFRLQYHNPIRPALFWSQTVRGGIGYQMKEKVCQNLPACKSFCENTPPCLFGRLYNEFSNSKVTRDVKSIVFREPVVTKDGKKADVSILLFNPEPYVIDEIVRDMYYLTEKGISRKRKFKIEYIQYLDLSGFFSLEKEGPMSLEESFRYTFQPSDLELKLLTPLCLEKRGKLIMQPTTEDILLATLRRLQFLAGKVEPFEPPVEDIPLHYAYESLEMNERTR
ncbi:MAG: hypothetical protein D6767_10895, partial [Candidatus Hydrogenedentota bacterium]